MCFSAIVKLDPRHLGLRFKARADLPLFEDLFRRRADGMKLRIPRGLESGFANPTDQMGLGIKRSIDAYRERMIREFETDLFTQAKRLADAERKLEEKPTKTAEKERGIATRKIEALKRRLETIRSDSERPDDSRIYTQDYASLIVWEKDERVTKPMRYLCRPAGFPETFDREFPGCYNARRDSLKKFWKNQYRRNHGILVISSFFENVKRHDFERRRLQPGEVEENLILQFRPRGFEEILVPCIWDRWSADGQADLYSFALITDEPPKEIREAGHDRCPIFLKESNIERWLQPEVTSEDELEAILNDPERPFYENKAVA